MTDPKKLSRRDLLRLGMVVGAAGIAGKVPPLSAQEESSTAPTTPATPAGSAAAPAAPAAKDASLPQVPRRVLGKTGASIPILVMGGGMALDERFDPKLAEVLRYGVNYYDTADCYSGGKGEVALGNFQMRAGVRKDIWITSKSDLHDPKGFETTLLKSLEKLQTDWVDMYFLHMLNKPEYLNDDLRVVVERLKKEGRLRHFGFSCHHHNVVECLHKAAATPWVEAVMFRYNFRDYGKKDLDDAIDACRKSNVGLIAMKTQGSEAGIRDAWKKFEGTGKWNKFQAVLKAVWADERITAAISHMDTFEAIKQNVAAAVDPAQLGAVDRAALEKYAAATRAHACDGCDHFCSAAVSAPVQIGTTLRCVMYHDVYGEPERAKATFARLPAEARRIRGVDFRGANAACPYGVDVAAHMDRAARIFDA
ncbi:MAG: aldo/keto reductase [bacterium]